MALLAAPVGLILLPGMRHNGPANGTPAPAIRVLVADPQRLLGESLARVLSKRGLDVAPEYPSSGSSAVEAATRLQPDVALVDYRMPDAEGPEIVRRIRQSCPGVKTILLSWFHGTREIEEALDSGAVGFFTRSLGVDQVAEGVRRAFGGESPVFLKELEELFGALSKRADAAAFELEQLQSLSPRELEVLTLLALDHTVQEVADEMGIRLPTVKMYIRKMLKKTGAFSTQEVLVKARLAGLIRT